MGLFSSLFGSKKKSSAGPTFNKAQLLNIAQNPISKDEDAEQILDLVGRVKNFNNKVEAFNILVEEGRKEWAEAYARVLAGLEDTPPMILKALTVQHFLEENKVEEYFEPARIALDEFPSETDLAIAIGRIHCERGDYETALKDLKDPLESAPDSRHLFALVGEVYRGMEKHEEAMIHLRTSLELYCEAFKLQTIITNELQEEEFEFTRIYGLLDEEAIALCGKDEKQKAFETLTVTPEEIGVRREGDRMALMRVEYKPRMLELQSIEDIAKREEELNPEKSEKHLLKGTIALRQGEYQKAIDAFRRALELDLENHGAYFGWASAGELQRSSKVDEASRPDLSDEETAALEKIFEDWSALSDKEKKHAALCASPIKNLLNQMAGDGAKVYIHPIDVRLKDVFPEPKEMAFEKVIKNPAAADGFTTEKESHLRLDVFLGHDRKRIALAYHLGLLAYKALSDQKKVESAFRADKQAHKLAKDAAGYFASAVQISVQKQLFESTELEHEIELSGLI